MSNSNVAENIKGYLASGILLLATALVIGFGIFKFCRRSQQSTSNGNPTGNAAEIGLVNVELAALPVAHIRQGDYANLEEEGMSGELRESLRGTARIHENFRENGLI